ncbi:MAG: hypothetical protein IT209_00460 [Armatimonadetes bacterium]|nr:hypothetical protein [Armatimonadota bacterium]
MTLRVPNGIMPKWRETVKCQMALLLIDLTPLWSLALSGDRKTYNTRKRSYQDSRAA